MSITPLSPVDQPRLDVIADALFVLAERGEHLALRLAELTRSPDWPVNLHQELGQLDAVLEAALVTAGIHV